jgi:hypothetical protein
MVVPVGVAVVWVTTGSEVGAGDAEDVSVGTAL